MRISFGTLIATVSKNVIRHVIPAKAEIYNDPKVLDSRLRGNDSNGPNSTFYDFIKVKAAIPTLVRSAAFSQ